MALRVYFNERKRVYSYVIFQHKTEYPIGTIINASIFGRVFFYGGKYLLTLLTFRKKNVDNLIKCE